MPSCLPQVYFWFTSTRNSKLELEGELDRARAADLIQRIEATIGATRAQAARQCLRGLTEERITQVVVGRAEVRMVENIEKLRPKLQVQLLG